MEHIPTLHPTAAEFANPIGFLSEAKVQRLGHIYGMVKMVPPDGFSPPFSINKDDFQFNVRIQNLSELSILNRGRLFFMKQLNNFNRTRRGRNTDHKMLLRPYVDSKDRKRTYLYDLFIQVLKEVNGSFDVSDDSNWSPRRKRSRDSSVEASSSQSHRNLSMPLLTDIISNNSLWKSVSRKLRVPIKELQDMFEKYISNYYQYLADQTINIGSDHFCNLLYEDQYPKSLLSDEDTTSFEDEDEDESDEEGCLVCTKSNNPTKMILCDSCDKPFHISCLSPPLSSIPKGEWICKNCIVGNGYYGFKEETNFYTLQKFQSRCNSREKELTSDCNNQPLPIEKLEEKFWDYVNNMEDSITVKYGADINGTEPGEISGFPSLNYYPKNLTENEKEDYFKYAKHPMNLLNLPNARGSLLPMFDRKISGMTVPWIYVGSTFSTFCWHLEDQYTLSANYQHEGAPKVWYSIPEYACDKFQHLMQGLAPDLFDKQPDLLHQLVTLVSPHDKRFKDAKITCFKAVQNPNEYIITFPKCYHAGFNAGYNFNEAVNFTLDSWLPYGIEAITDYQRTGKQCVFDMFELMLNVVIGFLKDDSVFDESLVRICYSELLNVLNSNMKMITQLSGVLTNEAFLKEIVRNDIVNSMEHKLPSPATEEDNKEDTRNGLNDEEDFDVFCSKCKTICFFAFVVHYKRPNARKRRRLHKFTRAQLNELAGSKELEILCLRDYMKLVQEDDCNDDNDDDDDTTDPFMNDELNYIRDPLEVHEILKVAGKKIDKVKR